MGPRVFGGRPSRKLVIGVGLALAAVTAGLVAVLGVGGPSEGHQTPGHRATRGGGGRLVVTGGGTYRGVWRSDDPDVPTVVVATAEPVRIVRSMLEGAGTLIASRAPHAKITVEDSKGVALYPGGRDRVPGRFLDAEGFDSVTVQEDELTGTSGIHLLNWAGGEGSAGPVRILRNRVRDIDGHMTDGDGGFSSTRARLVQFVQLDKVRSAPNMEIAWNEVINTPGRSRVEDNISVLLSSGTPSAPLRIHDNYIKGGYPGRPQDDYNGGGIMLGDGDQGGSAASGWAQAYDNQVVATTNYGLAIAAGHDLAIYRNRAVSSGRLPNGAQLAAQNVGVYVANLNHLADFADNVAYANDVSWHRPVTGMRNDWWLPDCAAPRCENHPLGVGAVSLADEAAEFQRWERKVASAGVHIGATW